MELIISALCGLIGGLTRACVGLLKFYSKNKKGKIDIRRILFTSLTSGIIGTFTGLLVSADFRISLLAGYAGTDLIEGLYKAGFKKDLKL
ncbi:hypothetical protein J4468_01630 [Candidatus Woesearchaeota archaeon]|nr:hypothetical protein [Candidatus Woesearchaeota archaeon]